MIVTNDKSHDAMIIVLMSVGKSYKGIMARLVLSRVHDLQFAICDLSLAITFPFVTEFIVAIER